MGKEQRTRGPLQPPGPWLDKESPPEMEVAVRLQAFMSRSMAGGAAALYPKTLGPAAWACSACIHGCSWLTLVFLQPKERGLWVSWNRLKGGRQEEGTQPKVHDCAVHTQINLSSPALGWTRAQCRSLTPSPLPSPTQKSHPASPHLSPSPLGNKIKAARDATTVLRKTQPRGVETTDPQSRRAG